MTSTKTFAYRDRTGPVTLGVTGSVSVCSLEGTFTNLTLVVPLGG